jgi:hypothetical protein
VSDPQRRLELLRSFQRNPRSSPQDFLRLRETATQLRTGLTPAQRDLQRFVPEAKEEESRERGRIRPLAFIMNILQTGQFVTANIAKELRDSWNNREPISQAAADAVMGAWEGLKAGLSGGKQGRPLSFTDVFYEDVPEEERTFWQKAAGFAADVLLDPTTYLTFGASSIGRRAAMEFAWNATSTAIKLDAPEIAAKVMGEMAQGALKNEAPEKVLSRLPSTHRKVIQDTYNQNFRRAMGHERPFVERAAGRTGGEEFEEGLRRDLQGRLNQLVTRQYPDATDVSDVLGSDLGRLTRDIYQDPHLSQLQKSIDDGFSGAGVRTARFAGIEVPGVAGRVLDAPLRLGRAVFESARSAFERSSIGERVAPRFGNAWWGLLNGGPVDAFRGMIGMPLKEYGMVGGLRKMFGFARTPYEQIRHAKMREHDFGYHAAVSTAQTGVDQLLSTLSENQGTLIRKALFDADLAAKKSDPGDFVDSATDILRTYVDDPDAEKVLDSVQELLVGLRNAEMGLANEDIIVPFGNVLNYFPLRFLDNPQKVGGRPVGSKSPGFTRPKTMTPQEHISQNKRNLSWVLGDRLDNYAEEVGKSADQVLDDLIENKGWSDIEIDLGEALKFRLQAHHRVMARGNMIRQFREFGIKESEIPAQGLKGGNVRALGLRQVDDPSLEGYLFDEDMASLIERAYDATETNEGAQAIRRLWAWNTRFWKGWATLTPRFHIRNAISNEMTLYLKHGLRAFDLKSKWQSRVAVTYALHKDRYIDILKDELNVSDGMIARALNSPVSPGSSKTLREVAEEAQSLGVIVPRGLMTRQSDPAGLTISSKVLDNPLFKFSQGVGDRIENWSRMTSYLLDYKKGAGVRGNAEYAAREARKWFLDYEDLTDFEKKVMHTIFPFYTWMRKNIVNQVSGLVLHGNLYSTIPKINRLGQSISGSVLEWGGDKLGLDFPEGSGASIHDEDIEYELLEGWEQNLGLFPVWKDRGTGKAVLFDPFFAYQDLNDIPLFWESGRFLPSVLPFDEGIGEILSSAHPVIKTIMELGFGKNVFKQRDIQRMEIAPKILQVFSEHKEVIGFMDGLMRLSGHSEGSKVHVDPTSGLVKMDGHVERMISNNLPLVRTIGSLIETAEVAAEVINRNLSSVVEEIGEERDYNTAFAKMLRVAAFWAGAKFREYDEKEREEKRDEETRRRAEAARRTERRASPGYETVRQESAVRRILENQRLLRTE